MAKPRTRSLSRSLAALAPTRRRRSARPAPLTPPTRVSSPRSRRSPRSPERRKLHYDVLRTPTVHGFQGFLKTPSTMGGATPYTPIELPRPSPLRRTPASGGSRRKNNMPATPVPVSTHVGANGKTLQSYKHLVFDWCYLTATSVGANPREVDALCALLTREGIRHSRLSPAANMGPVITSQTLRLHTAEDMRQLVCKTYGARM